MKITKNFMFSFENSDAPSIPHEGKPHRHFTLKPGQPILANDVIKTMYDNFMHGYNETKGEGRFLGTREIIDGKPGPYKFETYQEFLDRVTNLGSALKGEKIGIKKGDVLGLYSINRAEWVISEYAAIFNSIITVPLYDTLGSEALQFIINQVEMKVCALTKDKAKKLIEKISAYPTLKKLIIFDDIDNELQELAKESNLEIYHITELEKLGKENKKEFDLPENDTVACICYTSGTTGNPKGAILTNNNFLSFSRSVRNLKDNGLFHPVSHVDSILSYLPLAHVFERVVQITVIYYGASIGFYQGDTGKLLDDVAALKPTLFSSVPRLLNRIYDAVWSNIKTKGGFMEWMFNIAYNSKKRGLKRGTNKHWLWDRIVFNNIRAKLGGNVKAIYSGSAPLSSDVTDFLSICFSCDVQEGYAQTETAACLTLTDKWDMESGHVGGPMSTIEVKLRDIEDMGYCSSDKPFPRGEVCVRGNSVFKGYYKNPELTKEYLDDEGWFKTGDVGMWDEHNRLVIIDRVKNIFKLAQGEYVAPEKIEITYVNHPLINQIFIHGDSLESALVGIVVPIKEEYLKFARDNGVDTEVLSYEEVCQDKKLKKIFLKELIAYSRQQNLKGFEAIKNMYIEPHEFTEKENLVSPTLKIKRAQALQKYKPIIKELYNELRSGK